AHYLRLLLQAVQIAQQAEIEAETSEAGERSRDSDRMIAAQIRIHRGRQQPQLDHHDQDDDQEQCVDDRQALATDQASVRLHELDSSTPVAYTVLSRTSNRMRGKRRRGGPAIGSPDCRSNQPLWHGQWSLP